MLASARSHGRPLILACFALLIGVNVAAIWEIVRARRLAEAEALEELRLQTLVQARSLEARLAALRGDLVFLAQAAPIGNAASALSSPDPVTRRWRRLEMEGSLLLFLQAHAEVERILVRGPSGEVLLAAARREGAPVLVAAAGGTLPRNDPGRLLVGRFDLVPGDPGAGELVAAARTEALLSQVAPGLERELRIRRRFEHGAGPTVSGDLLFVRLPVEDVRWDPPISWSLERQSSRGRLLESVAELAQGYRNTVLLNLGVLALTIVLGLLAIQQTRRSAALEAQSREAATIRALESRLEHSERLAAVGRLAAGLAHEINNPLEGLSNYLELLEEDLRARRYDEAPGFAGKIRHGLDRIAGVVRRMLAFSTPGGAGKAELDLRDALREAHDFLAEGATYRNVRFELVTAAEPLPVLGDRAALGQLFLNLLLNACEIQERKGRVALRCERSGALAVITVIDDGPGIEASVLPRVFEPFYSTRNSSGLGLWVCYQVVQEHRGTITAGNEPGHGARFRVELPLARAGAGAAREA